MNIKKEKLNEIRKKVAEQLSKVPQGQRIKLPKDHLEILIFDDYVAQFKCSLNRLAGVKKPFKLIAWYMPYYDRLDLSEVSFDKVYWGDERILKCSAYIKPEINEMDFKYRPIVDLSNTNAKIDLSWATSIVDIEDKLNYHPIVRIINKYDFSNTDLSNNTIVDEFIFIDTDLSNTNINIKFNTKSLFQIQGCNLTNVDLSNESVGIEAFQTENNYKHPFISDSNLRYTGLRINLPTYEYVKTNSNLKNMILNGDLKGCIINDKVVQTSSKDERNTKKQQLKEELEELTKNFEESIHKSIEKQLLKK